MYLFVGISIITFLMTFSQSFIKFLSLGSRFMKQADYSVILKEINLAKQELKELEESDMEDFTKVVKKMRIENKIGGLCKRLKDSREMVRLKGASVDLVCGYAVKLILVLMLAYISFKYRYTPVVVFDDRFDFAPFGGIVTFPTGVPNAISVPFWVFSCNLSFKWFGSHISTMLSS
ncbi:guided entry of tail-anchored proteins factor 1 [Episyrphus balteatus]|uniref:guided entry of tail-anchored proteins factor 1 n=1 Tax=Episyrphus balteatus TaxID=286459 RepID=UPI002485BE50|nr:guided entry of tail-anchored proteins factor 1 [Episyrphus balteatus]